MRIVNAFKLKELENEIRIENISTNSVLAKSFGMISVRVIFSIYKDKKLDEMNLDILNSLHENINQYKCSLKLLEVVRKYKLRYRLEIA